MRRPVARQTGLFGPTPAPTPSSAPPSAPAELPTWPGRGGRGRPGTRGDGTAYPFLVVELHPDRSGIVTGFESATVATAEAARLTAQSALLGDNRTYAARRTS